MIIADLMSKLDSYIEADESLSKVITLMNNKAYSCLLVVNEGTPIGIITERDLVRMFADSVAQKSFEDLSVSVADVMTTEPICVQEKTTLFNALALAHSHQFRHFPVVDENEKLVGLVTQTDIVNACVNLFEKQTQLEDAVEELKSLSLEDTLLNIGNRRAMEADLDFTEATARRYQKHYAIALLDVDYFKNYNDHYGHQAGDLALQAITKALKSIIRDSDRLYRYGGEELLLIMPDTKINGAQIGVERLRRIIENMQYPHEGSPMGQLTVSIGIASELAGDWQTLVKSADMALYAAKSGGRNKVCCTFQSKLAKIGNAR